MSGVYHASVNVICFESSVLRERQFPLAFYGGGGWFAKWIVRFLIGQLVFRSGQKGQLRFAGVG